MSDEKKLTLSPYAIMNNWFRDGMLDSKIPDELKDTKAISPTFVLYFFISSPKYYTFINKVFNNYNLFSLPVADILKMIKEIIYFTGYKQPFTKKAEKTESNKLCDYLKHKYCYYRNEEISMAVDYIDSHDDIKEVVYEMTGLRNIAKKKVTKKEHKDKMSKILSKENLLNSI